MTNEQHNKYAAIAFFVHGGFQVLMTAFIGLMFFIMFSIPDRPGEPGPPMEFLAFFFGIMFLFQAVFTVPSFVAGYAMLKKKSWARLSAIIGGVIAAMSVPFGTAACVYALWFFLGDNWKEVYAEEEFRFNAGPGQIPQGLGPEWTRSYDDHFTRENIRNGPPDWR